MKEYGVYNFEKGEWILLETVSAHSEKAAKEWVLKYYSVELSNLKAVEVKRKFSTTR